MVERDWKQTACILCYVNCGIEVSTEGRGIVRVRGDKNHPHTAGYLCQKAQRLTFYGNHADRLTSPLRRRTDGGFDEISWEIALGEIAERLLAIRAEHGGKAFAFVGGGGQGNHLGGAYGVSLMRAMGSSNYYNALSQEKTGDFWVNGHLFGAQTCHTAEDIEHCDLLVVLGCNPWQAHGFRNARNHLNAIKNDEGRKLVVIDPRRTETAAMADVHLQLRPGTDAFLLSAMLALIVQREGCDNRFLAEHAAGFEDVRQVLSERVDIEGWILHAGVDRFEVDRAIDLILASRRMVVRAELGIQQARHSTLNSYLEKLIFLLTGNFGRPGTNQLHSWLQPLWGNSRGERAPVSGQLQVAGLYPTNILPGEILTDHPDRIRAVWVDSSNPANTYADTARVEAALSAAELTVVVDIAMTETARVADYVLPAASQYEKWEFTLFNFDFPTNNFHLRAPLFEPLPNTLPEPEIYSRLLRVMGLLPGDAVLRGLRQLAGTDRAEFRRRAFALIGEHPELVPIVPVLLYETLGRTLPGGAAGAAPLWLACHHAAGAMAEPVQRALGTNLEGGELAEALFSAVLSSRSGVNFAQHTYNEVWTLVKHADRRIHLAVPELLEWIAELDPAAEAPDPEYPFIAAAGQRRAYNANQIFRTPAWRKTDLDGALRVHPDDLAQIGAADGGWMAVETRTGRLVARIEADDSLRPGFVTLPHGYGQAFPEADGERVVNGPRINLITAGDDCDPIAATPYHRNVAVRLAAVNGPEADAAERQADRVRAIATAGGAAGVSAN